jgi:hypothetical protein
MSTGSSGEGQDGLEDGSQSAEGATSWFVALNASSSSCGWHVAVALDITSRIFLSAAIASHQQQQQQQQQQQPGRGRLSPHTFKQGQKEDVLLLPEICPCPSQ